ncbi:MAG: hypothetical protein V5A85_01920 [Haloarculaceae archaeon]
MRDTMHECRNCGSYVTPGFARVFGDDENEVTGCPRCAPFSAFMDGGGANRQ